MTAILSKIGDEPAIVFPREIARGVHWLSDCLRILYEGRIVHAYHSVYLIHGRSASLLVDTGLPMDWPVIERYLDQLVAAGVPPVRHLFPTHPEVPHSGNLGRLLRKFPEATVHADLHDYRLIYEEQIDRFVHAETGTTLDLGERTFEVVRPIIKDLATTQWGYDHAERVLFPSDGFAYMHHHSNGECGKTVEEVPALPLEEYLPIFAYYALSWTAYSDMRVHVEELRRLLDERPTSVVAPGHGSPILELERVLPQIEEGMIRCGANSRPFARR